MRNRILHITPSARFLASVPHSHPSSSSSSNNTLSSKSESTKFKKPVLSLDQFIQRQRVLSFWREIIRAVYKIPPSSTRSELRNYAKSEFERNKGVEDAAHIRYLLSAGKTEFDTMRRYIDELAAR